ncbi:hypothetical protein [Pedobacter sp. NJ-S-72]
MENLQKRFGDRIKILPVTEEKENLVLNFWKTNKYTKELSIPSVVEDKVLNSYFKHRSVPHEVWIYKGKVIGITEPEYVDENNIQKVLSGVKVNWPVKYDYYVYNSTQPLFSPDNNQIDTSNTILKYASICGYLEKIQSEAIAGGVGTIRDKQKKTIRTYFLNESIFAAYVLNWNHAVELKNLVKPSYIVDPNQVIWDVSDKSKYIYLRAFGYRQDWLRLHGICFESQNPDTGQTDNEVAKSVINDMNALLGLNVRWEKRREKVLNLVKKETGGGAKLLEGKSYSLSSLSYELNQHAENPYVFNKSKSEEKLNLNIQSWTDIPAIRKALQLYGYDLEEEEKEVDKFVFSEIDGGLLVDALKQAEFKVKKDAQKKK